MKRILFLCDSLEAGAEAELCVRLANLCPDGYEPAICTLSGGALRETVRRGVLCRTVFRRPHPLISALFHRAPPSQVARFCGIPGADITVAVGDGLCARLLCGLPDTRRVLYLLHDPAEHSDAPLRRAERRYREADVVLCASLTVYRGMLTRYGELRQMRVAYPPASERRLLRMLHRGMGVARNERGCFVALSDGVHEFGTRIFEVVSLLLPDHPDFRVCLICRPEERDALLQEVQNRKLEAHVAVFGEADNPYPRIAASRGVIFCEPCLSLGYLAADAMLLHVPVFAPRYGVARELIRDACHGCLCDNSASGLARGIAAYLDGDTGWNADCAARRARAFSDGACMDSIIMTEREKEADCI